MLGSDFLTQNVLWKFGLSELAQPMTVTRIYHLLLLKSVAYRVGAPTCLSAVP